MRFLWALLALAVSGAVRPPEVAFEKITIDLGASEPAAFADINRDGKLDIVSGEFWYEAPSWTPHRFREIPFTSNYVDDFCDLVFDVDGDGWLDVVSVSWFGQRMAWWKNPGRGQGLWKEQNFEQGSPVEFAELADLDNDGKAREVLPQFGDEKTPLAWYEFRGGAWVKHVVSNRSYGHGIGAGDVNGDGRTDIITPKGWFEAPADVRAGAWVWHPDFDLGDTGFIHVLDVNGDGRPDLVTSLAHNYGIFWMERGAGGGWTKHLIDDSWSQAHAVSIVDVNGDGRMDLLTGKRYMAHNGHDPGEREPLGVYWYESQKDSAGGVTWVRHVIDYGTRAGGGMQIATGDVNGDGALDFAVGGKSGLFLFLQQKGRPRTGAGAARH
ncbi:MAG TPA: VCBS repeat-containing protein [Bryobacteraceae bacterium]